MAEENIRCPKCGSKDVDRHWGDKLFKLGAGMVGGILENYIFGSSGETGGEIAGEFVDEISQNYVCKKCGHNFTKEDTYQQSSNTVFVSNKEKSNSGGSHNKTQFSSPKQNALHKELRTLSSDKGGFSNSDYALIINLGNSYGLSKDQIYEVAKKCMWKNGVKPSMPELFGNNSFSKSNNYVTTGYSNTVNSPLSKNQGKLTQDLITNRNRWSPFDYRYVVERGIHYRLTEDEIYAVLINLRNDYKNGGNIFFSDYQPESRSTIFSRYKIPKSYGNVNDSNNSHREQVRDTTGKSSINSAFETPFSSNAQNSLYQELYALSSDKGGLSQADFDMVVKVGNSYNLTQDEIFEVAKKCLWKSWITLTKEQLFNSNVEQSATASSTSNKEIVMKNEVSDNEKEYIEELKSIYSEQSEITDRERRLLNRLSKSLGIPDERAKELEDQVNPNSLSDKEQEYAEEIKACLEDDGVISDRERRILNRLATSLDITTERAEEIEKIIISRNE